MEAFKALDDAGHLVLGRENGRTEMEGALVLPESRPCTERANTRNENS